MEKLVSVFSFLNGRAEVLPAVNSMRKINLALEGKRRVAATRAARKPCGHKAEGDKFQLNLDKYTQGIYYIQIKGFEPGKIVKF